MSEHLIITEPDVLTGHTEVIYSTSIERIFTRRNTALAKTESLIHQLEDISAITRNIGSGTAIDWAPCSKIFATAAGSWRKQKRR